MKADRSMYGPVENNDVSQNQEASQKMKMDENSFL